jgi:hypothetical protein
MGVKPSSWFKCYQLHQYLAYWMIPYDTLSNFFGFSLSSFQRKGHSPIVKILTTQEWINPNQVVVSKQRPKSLFRN